MNTQEIDLRTKRTNYITREREEATSWKVGVVETWFSEETDCQCCGGEGILVTETGEGGKCEIQRERGEGNAQWVAQEKHFQEKHFPKGTDWENERVWFS